MNPVHQSYIRIFVALALMTAITIAMNNSDQQSNYGNLEKILAEFPDAADSTAIIRAGRAFAAGRQSGDRWLLNDCLMEQFVFREVLHEAVPGRMYLRSMDRSQFLKSIRTRKWDAGSDRHSIRISILDTYRHSANLEIRADETLVLCQLAELDGKWKIVNALEVGRGSLFDGTVTDGERAAIRQTGIQMLEGWYNGDPQKMDRVLHEILAKRGVVPNRNSGKIEIRSVGKTEMVEAAEKGTGKLPREKWSIDADILGIYGNIAVVRIRSEYLMDVCQLVNFGGEWKIVNVIWEIRSIPPWW